MENKYLVQMFNLSESLIYYQSSLALNYDAIVKLHLHSKRNNFTEITINSLENLKIENEQALKQAEIYSEVFSGLMDIRASIVNNNMNQLMKKLTIINIIFLPLNLIAGIFGKLSLYTIMPVCALLSVASLKERITTPTAPYFAAALAPFLL